MRSMRLILIVFMAVFIMAGTLLAVPEAASADLIAVVADAAVNEAGLFDKIWIFIQEIWKTAVGTIMVLIAGFYIPGVRTLLILGIKVLFSEKIGKLIFFAIAQKLVDGTTTTVDNKWLEELRKQAG